MRLLFVIFLICLLPLRGWAGTAMGMQMATAQVMASNLNTSSVKDPANRMLATMPDDCAMHLEAISTAANESADSKPSCSGCDTCELCLAIASFTTPQLHTTRFGLNTAPAAAHHGFVSADRASRLKPPIS